MLALAAGQGATWIEPLLLPALAVSMTLTTIDITNHDLASIKSTPRPILISLLLNYVVMGSATLLMTRWLISDRELWGGFATIIAMPPAIAVVPFSYMLGGNTTFSLTGLVATYLAALALTPAMMVLFLDVGFFNPLELLSTLGQLVVIPLVLSRILLFTGLTRNINKWRGTVVNWSFFVVVFTIIGLNRQVFFGNLDVVLKIAIIAIITTFVLGFAIELIAKARRIDQPTNVSLILFGTKKNYGLASVIALTLLSERAAIPGTIFLVFAILHTVFLSFHFKKKPDRH